MSLLPVVRAHELHARPADERWLVEHLWAESAVGIVGGEPKCGKSFLALDLAVSVASGAPCLRRFTVARPGTVLLFAAEDALHVVRERLLGICAASNLALADLDLHVITAATLRLDLAADARRLADTVASLRPRLLVLDPFVRLHRIDENVSAAVAPLLASLREIQRRHATAVVLVHHSRKGGGTSRPGQALRGSSELHAWGDSNLYLRRRGDRISLSVEHRAAPSIADLPLRLHAKGDVLALEIAADARDVPTPDAPLASAVRSVLANAGRPLAHADIRQACRVRAATLSNLLADLVRDGSVTRTEHGYLLA